MKLATKVGVSILSLLMFAAPIMGCALPETIMTMAERECCKQMARMAQDCGKGGMSRSHSCCQTAAAPDHSPVINSSSQVFSEHPTSVLVQALPPMLLSALTSAFASRIWMPDVHPPPISHPVSISVLRI